MNSVEFAKVERFITCFWSLCGKVIILKLVSRTVAITIQLFQHFALTDGHPPAEVRRTSAHLDGVRIKPIIEYLQKEYCQRRVLEANSAPEDGEIRIRSQNVSNLLHPPWRESFIGIYMDNNFALRCAPASVAGRESPSRLLVNDTGVELSS